MKRLWILGNGFDLSHGLNTSYEDFRKYLIAKYGYTPFNDEFYPFNDDMEISLIIDMIGLASEEAYWKDIENALGCIYRSFNRLIDEKRDFDEQRIIGVIIANCLKRIPLLFSEWVDTIEIEFAKPLSKFENLFALDSNVYITFNYTSVLEKTYHIEPDKICHIHGLQHNPIIFGHSRNLTPEIEFSLREDLECAIEQLWSDLKKDTMQQILKNKSFFEQMSPIKEIYSYGFSFSEPDLPYIQEICKKTNNDTVWYFSSYENLNTRKTFEKIIREKEFMGEISTFSIN